MCHIRRIPIRGASSRSRPCTHHLPGPLMRIELPFDKARVYGVYEKAVSELSSRHGLAHDTAGERTTPIAISTDGAYRKQGSSPPERVAR